MGEGIYCKIHKIVDALIYKSIKQNTFGYLIIPHQVKKILPFMGNKMDYNADKESTAIECSD
jgi:hypothetical protein